MKNELQIKIIATGSKGNCYLISDGPKAILIDPGIRFERIQQATGFNTHLCDFCLISHEHKDHSLSAKNVERIGVELVMSSGTFEALTVNTFYLAQSERHMEIKGWDILPFGTQHDAAEPLGFLIRSPSGHKILYATDTYYIRYKFAGVTHYMIEANYQKELLDANESLHPLHKDRVLKSHMEIETLKKFFRKQDLSKTKKIYLIHLSDDNSDEAYFKSEIEKITAKPVYFR